MNYVWKRKRKLGQISFRMVERLILDKVHIKLQTARKFRGWVGVVRGPQFMGWELQVGYYAQSDVFFCVRTCVFRSSSVELQIARIFPVWVGVVRGPKLWGGYHTETDAFLAFIP